MQEHQALFIPKFWWCLLLNSFVISIVKMYPSLIPKPLIGLGMTSFTHSLFFFSTHSLFFFFSTQSHTMMMMENGIQLRALSPLYPQKNSGLPIQAYLTRRILPRYKYRYLVSEDILRMRVDSLTVHEIMASLQKRQLHFCQYAIKVGFE